MVINIDCREIVSVEQEPECTMINTLFETAATLKRVSARWMSEGSAVRGRPRSWICVRPSFASATERDQLLFFYSIEFDNSTLPSGGAKEI